MCVRILVGSLVVSLAASAAWAQPLGTAFTYQGRLENAGSLAGGLHDLRFRLYSDLTGGAQVGTTLCADDLSVNDGLFTVSLDFGAQFAGSERFLEIDVRDDTGLDCGNPAGFVILEPRQALGAAPNALFAVNADRLGGLSSTAFLQSIPVPLTLSGTNSFHIIRGENASTSVSAGVLGVSTAATGTTHGVRGINSSTSGIGVAGNATASIGETIGVLGNSASTSGTGVYGIGGQHGGHFETNSANASAVLANATNGAYGVWAQSIGPSGFGVFAAGATGVVGQGGSTSGMGVFGQATAGSGTTYGGRFESASPAGFGGLFKNTSLSAAFDVELSGPNGAINTTGTVNAGQFVGGGAGLTGLNASNLATGTVPVGRFPVPLNLIGANSDIIQAEKTSDTFGAAVRGICTAAQGFNYGVYGQNTSSFGVGVSGNATAIIGSTIGVFGQSASPSGAAGFFDNVALGSAFDVTISGPNGAINTPGFVYREYTASTPSAAIPVAYGSISSSGAINGGTGNFTVSHTVTGEYDITISGETYSNSSFAVSVTPLHNTIPVCGTAADVGAPLRINIWRLDTAVKADIAFQFVAYARNPSGPG